jgi:hypothetical protein
VLSRSRLSATLPGPLQWRAAFLDIHSCANLLSQTINALGADPFVRDFDRQENGSYFNGDRPILLNEFECRDQRGRARASHVRIFMQKVDERPHKLHLITFYPTIPTP